MAGGQGEMRSPGGGIERQVFGRRCEEMTTRREMRFYGESSSYSGDEVWWGDMGRCREMR